MLVRSSSPPRFRSERDRHDQAEAAPRAMDGKTGSARPVLYFTNCYPKISHSFIRNEIAALERQGMAIVRVTIRRSNEGLIDPADQRETERTQVLLKGGVPRLLLAVLSRALRDPARFFAVLADTLWRRPAGWWRSFAYFIEGCRLVGIAEANGIRHIHVHFGTNPAAIALLASRLGRVTFSMTVHGPDEFDAPQALDLRRKIAGATFVVAVSDFGRSQLWRWADLADWAKIAVVRCGVAPAFDVAPSIDVAGLQSHTLVCIARLDPQKGLPVLLEAAELLARTERFCLRIIGDGELRPAIEAAVKSRNLGGHVRLTGWLSAEEVRRELLAARALVLPSFAEGLPVVLMEAMGLGRTVIATAIAGIPELVNADAGWLVPAGSADALADAMRHALHADVDQLVRMGIAGRMRVRRQHDIDRNAAQLADLLRHRGELR